MAVAPIEMLKSLVFTLVLGFILTWIFDTISEIIKEILYKYIGIVNGILDFIFSVSFSFLLILLLYYCNKGIYRAIYLISLLSGIFIYFSIFCGIFRKISKIILLPIKYIFVIIRKIYIFLLHSIEKLVLKLYNNNEDCKI